MNTQRVSHNDCIVVYKTKGNTVSIQDGSLKKLEPRGWWGDEQVDDTGLRVMREWDEYTPEYDGDDHLSNFYQESKGPKIDGDEAADLVRHYYLKHEICLLWNDSNWSDDILMMTSILAGGV